MYDVLLSDIRYTLRSLRRSPGLALVVILTLGLAIGANTALFSLFNAIVLRPLPVTEPERLAVISVTDARGAQTRLIYQTTFDAFRRSQQAFDALTLYSGGGVLRAEARGVTVDGGVASVMPEYFEMLGVRPLLGRLLSSADAEVGDDGAQLTVIGHRFWQRVFGGDPRAIGEVLRVEGRPLTIVGVTPPGFYGLEADAGTDFFMPMATLRLIAGDPKRPVRGRNAIGRLRPGVSLERARAEVAAAWPAIQIATIPAGFTNADQADMRTQRVAVDSMATGFSTLRNRYANPLVVLVGLTALLVTIACANLSGLLLARAITRQEQLAIRRALGASRGRLVQQQLVESLLLSICGSILAVPLAWWVCRIISGNMWAGGLTPLVMSMTPDVRVLGAAALVAVGTGLLVGIVPAWITTGGRADAALRPSRTIASSIGRTGRILAVTQIALSLALLVGAGLLVKSLLRLRGNDAAFPAQHVVWARLWLQPAQRGTPIDPSYYLDLVRQLSQIPGAESVALSQNFPALFNVAVVPESFAPADAADAALDVSGISDFVSPGFFETLGIRQRQGRDFTWDDDARRPLVAIVNATLARRLAPSGDAIGQRVRLQRTAGRPALEIVGIVDDAPVGNLREPHVPALFRPMLQDVRVPGVPIAHVRASRDVNVVRREYARVVASLGRNYLRNVYTLDEQVDQSLLQERLVAWFSSSFAGLALILSCLGVYGLLAFAVLRRTREIGVRMALGATRSAVLCKTVLEAAALALVGVGLGVPCALAAGRLVRSQLYGLAPDDPTTLISASIVFIVVAVLSGLLPAYRASTIDPMSALRDY